MADEKYFNFPIPMLIGFMKDYKTALDNISDYACYAHAMRLEYGDEEDAFDSAIDFFDIKRMSKALTLISFENGQKLYHKYIGEKTPTTGLSLKIFWDYYKGEKNDFQKACLLAHLALKSIVGNKDHCKLDNRYMLARMDGKLKPCDFDKLSPEIFKFANEYQTKKIKAALVDGWGLVTYSHYTRGFYVSYKLSLTELIVLAEDKRQSVKDEQRKRELEDARRAAMEIIKNRQR